MVVPDWLALDDAVRHVHHQPASPGESATWPSWLSSDVTASLVRAGLTAPWAHQARVAEHAWSGRHVTISTPTASGKTLGYLLPILQATASAAPSVGVEVGGARAITSSRGHTALYLSPTKALSHDQWRAARHLGPAGWPLATLDGDSTPAERRYARSHARFVLTNPDMLHRSVLPNHPRWASFLGNLRYVVIDEAHRCRGVFGSHVAAVIRRLRRLCRLHGADPVFILASATAQDVGSFAGQLIGAESVAVVDRSSAPQPGRDIVLWQPHDSTTTDAARLLARFTDEDRQTICFVASRAMAELIAVWAGEHQTSARRIVSYRAGHLPGDRRTVEAALQTGDITSVAATNALELGVDIAGMDAVLIAGFPGTLASFWQQAGRAGRRDREAVVTLIARDDPLDSYLFAHPELIFERPVEKTVLDASNPHVLAPHLAAAAQESCLVDDDARWFGPTMTSLADQLTSQGLLRRRPSGWFWTRPERAVDSIDLRSAGGHPIDIVDTRTGRIIGSVDRSAADRTVHPGAVYLHQGDTWLVDEYLPDDYRADVHAERPTYYTQAQSISEMRIITETAFRAFGRGVVHTGQVRMMSQVTGYLRRDAATGDVWDATPLELPQHEMITTAMWWTIGEDVTDGLGLNAVRLAAGAHAAEHTAIGLLPAFVTCDRWDIGGLSTLLHPDTGTCTIVVHDGHPGGAGFAEQGYQIADGWARATLDRLVGCPCEAGCPACVVSPKCGNANQMLDKDAATLLVTALLAPRPAG